MRKHNLISMFAATAAGIILMTPMAHADVKCRVTVAKESSKATQAIAKTLQKCEQGVVAGKIAGPCSADTKTNAAITKVKDKLKAAITKKCGTSTGEFTYGRCPNSNGGTGTASPCSGILIQSKDGVGECLGCLARENATELVSGVMYGSSITPTDKAIGKCQATVGQAATAYYLTRSKLLAGCQAALLTGKVASCPDTKTSDGLAAAEAKKVAAITKACCGDDETCGGGTCSAGGNASGNPATGDACEANRDCNRCVGGADDGTSCFVTAQCVGGVCSSDGLCESDDYRPINDLGFPVPCPGIQSGSSAIVFTGQTMQSVLTCLDTQADQRSECQNAAGAISSYNGSLPSGCSAPVTPCNATGGPQQVTVVITSSAPDLGGLSLSLGYQNVTLPGTGGAASGRVVNLQSGFLEEGDFDDVINIGVTDPSGLAAGALVTVAFDTCAGVPTPANFGCVVRSASDIGGAAILDGVSCSVTVP